MDDSRTEIDNESADHIFRPPCVFSPKSERQQEKTSFSYRRSFLPLHCQLCLPFVNKERLVKGSKSKEKPVEAKGIVNERIETVWKLIMNLIIEAEC